MLLIVLVLALFTQLRDARRVKKTVKQLHMDVRLWNLFHASCYGVEMSSFELRVSHLKTVKHRVSSLVEFAHRMLNWEGCTNLIKTTLDSNFQKQVKGIIERFASPNLLKEEKCRLWDALAGILLALNPGASFHPSSTCAAFWKSSARCAPVHMEALATSVDSKDSNGLTALHRAVWNGQTAQAAALLKQGANVNAKLPCGGTALHVAAAAEAVSTVELLLAAGAHQCRDNEGQLPLHAAASAGADWCTELLIGAGAEVDALDAYGFSPLRWTCLNGHAKAAFALLEAGADGKRVVDGLMPLALASAAGHIEVVNVLAQAGIRDEAGEESSGCVTAAQIATEMHHKDILELLQHAACNKQGAIRSSSTGTSRAGLKISREMPSDMPWTAREALQEVDTDALALNHSIWDTAFMTSRPLLVHGCGRELADVISSRSVEDLHQCWGSQEVTVFFSKDEIYQRPMMLGSGSLRFLQPPVRRMRFSDYIDLLSSHGHEEFFAVQSPLQSSDEFEGLTRMPPLLESLIGQCEDQQLQRAHCHGEYYCFNPRPLRSTLWVCAAPKISRLHFDDDDSVLLQLSGSKHFTLVAPGPLHGLTAYPRILRVDAMDRLAPGVYKEREPSGDDSALYVNNFPLVNVSNPDLDRHPLFGHAQIIHVDVHEGDALLLPAYWYHEVSSSSPEGKLNVAINYWFGWDKGVQGHADADGSTERGTAPPQSRIHRIFRERLAGWRGPLPEGLI